VPDAVCALDTLVDPNYSDIVTAAVSEMSDRTPEQWLRAMFAGVPRGLLLLVPFIQRVALGLRLELRASPDRVIGWKIVDRGYARASGRCTPRALNT